MLSLALKILHYELFRLAGRLRRCWNVLLLALAPQLVQTRCARRMDALSGRLREMRTRIEGFEAHVQHGCAGEVVDADRRIHAMLRGLKEDIRMIGCELAEMHRPSNAGYGAQRMQQALTRLHRVAEETYSAADRLLWEIDEHDHACRAGAP